MRILHGQHADPVLTACCVHIVTYKLAFRGLYNVQKVQRLRTLCAFLGTPDKTTAILRAPLEALRSHLNELHYPLQLILRGPYSKRIHFALELLWRALPAGDSDPANGLDDALATCHVGSSMSDTEQAEFAAAITDCENATVEICPPLRSKIRYPGLYMLFGILDAYQWLDNMTHEEILTIVDTAGLDRYQNRVEDVNYLTKRLLEYRRWQK